MKKINKKRIVLLIILVCLLILQIKIFTDSQANNVIEITLKAKDNETLLEDSQQMLEAIDEGESGYSFTLPEIVNEKKISKYYITEKTIENEEEITSEVEKNPGDKVYLTEEEKVAKIIEVKVKYDTLTEENIVYYNSQKEEEINNKVIQVGGYIKNGDILTIENKTQEEVTRNRGVLK